MRRRAFLLGATGIAGLAWLNRPDEEGGSHDAYFQNLSAELNEHGLARPTMLLDLDRLDHNIAELRKSIRDPVGYRVVTKSLPCPQLLDYVMQAAGTDRQMIFHQPFLNQIARNVPRADVLIGKPMPVRAASRFYDRLQPGGFDPSRQLQWLVDTPARLKQYGELGAGRNLAMRINIEIDVGLHRGGVSDPAELAAMLRMIDASPRLSFSGLMGYDAHVAKVPSALGLRQREFNRVLGRYRDALKVWHEHSGKGAEGLTLNAAGSPTFRLWEGYNVANELAAGSGLVQPLDFDVDTLVRHLPAVFISTPVLKASASTRIPTVPSLGRLHAGYDPNRAQTFFVYGGYWKARPVSPPGLRQNPVYGRSTNQEILNGSSAVRLNVDDFVFYRPTQSEFVMLQFGDLAVVRDGRIIDFWPVFQQTA